MQKDSNINNNDEDKIEQIVELDDITKNVEDIKPTIIKNAKEEIYDRINIPVKSLDIIIRVLFGLLILALILGIYFGNN